MAEYVLKDMTKPIGVSFAMIFLRSRDLSQDLGVFRTIPAATICEPHVRQGAAVYYKLPA